MAGKNSIELKAPDACPVCGKDVPPGALACPECGADYNSGWRQHADTYDAVDLPDEDFNYDHFVRVEFGSGPKPTEVKTAWWIAAIVLIVVLLVIYLSVAH